MGDRPIMLVENVKESEEKAGMWLKNKGNPNKSNPFRASFYSVVLICCILLSVVCLDIGYMNEKRLLQARATDNAERIMKDWETQLQQMKRVAVRIISDYTFHPYMFRQDINMELDMLEEFQRYKDYSVLTEEYFLDYGIGRIYQSVGTTLDFELYLQMMSENEEERRLFREEIEMMQAELSEICGNPKVITAFGKLYILIPIELYAKENASSAVLGFVVSTSALQERFQYVGSYVEGTFTLYGEEEVLCSNSAIPVERGHKGVVMVTSANGLYTICFRPELKNQMYEDLFLLLLLLILVDLILVFVLSNIFAKKTYVPVQVLAEKYRKKLSNLNVYHENAIEEIRYMLDDILEKNRLANAQIQENQKEIRNQFLRMALESRDFSEMSRYMEKTNIYLPGSFYCVASISFTDEDEVSGDFLKRLQEEIEQIPDEKEEEYIYAVCNDEKKLINVIISVPSEENKAILLEMISDVASSFSYKPMIGIGNMYSSIRNLSASYLESMDEIRYQKSQVVAGDQKGFVLKNDHLRKIFEALESGSEKHALENLEIFVTKLGESPMSTLMLHYIISEFLGEFGKQGKKYNIEISKKNISLLVSVRDVMDFQHAAKNVIHEFCEKQDALRGQMEDEEAAKILECIHENYMQYDISIDSIAEKMQTNTETVRRAVQKLTGKLYRDYLISLRIEKAKKLLLQEDISIAELCEKIGYSNVSYFIKLFRQVVGITPAQYRKSLAGFKGDYCGQSVEAKEEG